MIGPAAASNFPARQRCGLVERGHTDQGQADAPFPSTFSTGLGPVPLRRTKFCSRSNQNGAPKKVESAVISQPIRARKKTRR